MLMSIRKAAAFIKRDFQIFLSYKLVFLLHWLGILITVTTFYFLSRFLERGILHSFNGGKGGYFGFVLIGIALSGYLRMALGGFAEIIQREQMLGTLEAILSTPVKASTVVLCMSLWNFIFSSISVAIYLLSGVFLFGLRFSHANMLPILVVIVLSVLAFSGIGILLASFIMIFKGGSHISWFITSLFSLLGGVYFPITILPKYLQFISHSLPLTYSVRALRGVLLRGYSLIDLGSDIFVLLIFSIILFPFSIFAFHLAVKKVKKDGSLIYY